MIPPFTRQMREEVLQSFSASLSERDELLAHNELAFVDRNPEVTVQTPYPDEPFVAEWEQYARLVQLAGTIAPLSRYLVQFTFPIQKGISETPAYIEAVRRGETDGKLRLQLKSPESARLYLHGTAAGRIPVLQIACREDFETILRALTHRNEPAPVAQAQGACMIAGYTNWNRVRAACADKGLAPSELPKSAYLDRLILLSDGDYSGVKASELGLSEGSWRKASATIRLEHECAHYVTRRLFDSMRNDALNELIADYAGIVAAEGRFRADWFLHFLGLEKYPFCRPGGRLSRYRGKPPLSDGAFQVQQKLVYAAAKNVEKVSVPQGDTLLMIAALTQTPLEIVAHQSGPETLNRLLSLAALRWGARTGTAEVEVAGLIDTKMKGVGKHA